MKKPWRPQPIQMIYVCGDNGMTSLGHEKILNTNNEQMINSILKSTRGKPCSCPSGKICSDCKSKKNVYPQVTIKQPKDTPELRNITYHKHPEKVYNRNATTAQYFEKPNRWRIRKRQKYEPPPPKSPICRWYKRRKALKQLIKEHEKEKELLRKKKREEYERERVIDFISWHQTKQQRSTSLPPSLKNYKWDKTKTERFQSLTPPPKKITYIKEKAATVKPRAHSKRVSVKQRSPRDSITKRFVNYCYRFCCQLYCYLTCIVIITFIILYIM